MTELEEKVAEIMTSGKISYGEASSRLEVLGCTLDHDIDGSPIVYGPNGECICY